MSDQEQDQVPVEQAPQPSQMALAVSILVFVGLYLWGFVLSIVEMSQRDSTG